MRLDRVGDARGSSMISPAIRDLLSAMRPLTRSGIESVYAVLVLWRCCGVVVAALGRGEPEVRAKYSRFSRRCRWAAFRLRLPDLLETLGCLAAPSIRITEP